MSLSRRTSLLALAIATAATLAVPVSGHRLEEHPPPSEIGLVLGWSALVN